MASTSPSTVLSRSAESNTTTGDLPPSSKDSFLPLPAVSLRRTFPTYEILVELFLLMRRLKKELHVKTLMYITLRKTVFVSSKNNIYILGLFHVIHFKLLISLESCHINNPRTKCTSVYIILYFQCLLGSMYVSGKLPTYPSPILTFCPKGEVSGEGRWAVSQKHRMICLLYRMFYDNSINKIRKTPLAFILNLASWTWHLFYTSTLQWFFLIY